MLAYQLIYKHVCGAYGLNMKSTTVIKSKKETINSHNKSELIKNRIPVQLMDPIDILMKEHEMGLEQLEIIARAAESIQMHGFSGKAFLEIAHSTRVIDTEMRWHNEKEEKYLFTLLDKHVFESPHVLRHNRREMWQAFNELMMSVKDVEEGRIHGTTIHELIHSAEMVVERFRKQIEKENTIIFPIVRRVLTNDEYEQLRHDICGVVQDHQR